MDLKLEAHVKFFLMYQNVPLCWICQLNHSRCLTVVDLKLEARLMFFADIPVFISDCPTPLHSLAKSLKVLDNLGFEEVGGLSEVKLIFSCSIIQGGP